MMNSYKTIFHSKLFPYFLLLLLAIISYWQIFFLHNSIKWDMLDCYLPWRYFVSDTIQNGVFPLWNPFQQLGYPIHADLRSVWNPVVLFISIFTRYSNYTLHYLLIFYLFIAGVGMYKFMLFFRTHKNIAFISAAVYMLSGFFISHTQEISAFSAAAFLPFILLFYLKFFKSFKTIDILKVAVFLFFMITGSYPALTIILAYLLATIFIYYFIQFLIKKDYKLLKTILINNLLLLLIVILLSSVFIVILSQVGTYVSRMGGLTYKDAIFGSFTPQSMISFLLPFSAVKNKAFFDTNFTMANAYFGIIFFIFFIYSLFKKKTSLEYLLLGFAVIALFASFGGYTPVRRILFDYFPLMNRFRFPGFFNLFAVFIFIFLAAKSFSENNIFFKNNKKILLGIACTIFLILTAFLIFSSQRINFSDFHFFNSEYSFWESIKKSNFYEHIFLQAVVNLIIISVFIFLIIKNFKNKFIGLLIIIEMIIAVQLNMYYTGVSDVKPSTINQYLSNCPKNYSIPQYNLISLNTDKNSGKLPLWKNTNIFTKKVSFDTFNSFQLDGYAFLNDSCPKLKEAMLKNNLLYFSDKIIPDNLLKANHDEINNTDLFVDKSVFEKLENLNLKTDISDSIKIIKFSPDNIIANFKTKNQQIITLLQSNYYGWKVFIDNAEVKHFTSNFLSISTLVQRGNHKIEFKYQNKTVIYGFLISYFVFFILLISLVFCQIKKTKKYKVYYFAFLIITIFVISFQIIKLINKDVIMHHENKTLIFDEINKFEENNENWKLKSDNITNEISFSEKNSYKIDSLSNYDCVFKAPLKNVTVNKNFEILVKIKVFINSPVNSFLVLSVLRNKKRIFWKGVPISDKLINANKWQNIEVSLKNNELKQGDVIKSYIWNKGKNNFYVDDYQIKIFTKD